MWSKIDDKLHSSQQARTAGLEAMGLWTLAESYCGDQLTDGFIPAWWVIKECGKRKGIGLADKLVAAGSWERAELATEKGWNSLGYLDRNKARAWVLEQRQKTAKRQAEWRDRQKDDEERNAVTNDVRNAYPDPTRPDQTRSGGSVGLGAVEKSGTAHAREASSCDSQTDNDHADEAAPLCTHCHRDPRAKDPDWSGFCGACISRERERLRERADGLMRAGYDQ